MSTAIVGAMSGAGLSALVSLIVWIWKFSSLMTRLTDAVSDMRKIVVDHETRLRAIERMRLRPERRS